MAVIMNATIIAIVNNFVFIVYVLLSLTQFVRFYYIGKSIVYRVHQAHNISSASIIHSITKTDIIIAKINTVRVVNITMSR